MNREHENVLSPGSRELEQAINDLVAKHGKLMVITMVAKLEEDQHKIRAVSILSRVGMTLRDLMFLSRIV